MKKTNLVTNRVFSKFIAVTAGAALLAVCTFNASAQSIGLSFVSNGADSGIGGTANAETDALLPTDLAGVAPYAQTNWNNLGYYGGVSSAVVTNSAGNPVTLELNWDSGGADTTGSGAALGTGDGKLMDGFIYSWGPGAASALQSSVYGNPINNKPMVYVSGLNSWFTSEGAEGYSVVLYTTGYSYYEVGEYWLQSITGDPLANTMAAGPDLTPHYFVGDTGPFTGTYVQATGTSSAGATYGANYVFFTGLTNNAVLIRNDIPSGSYGSGINGFQIVPIFPAAPTTAMPNFAPSNTVYAGVSVTVTEAATGDPFQTNLYYQWFSDYASGGAVTNLILNATNATLNVTPTNNAVAYAIQYLCVVSNIFGVSTSSVAVLTVNPAVAPFITQDTTPGAGNSLAGATAYAGGTVSFSAAFGGTPPAYLWQSNSVNIANATNTTLTLTNIPLSASGAGYQLTGSNSVGGAASTPTILTVLADPAAPNASVPYAYDVFTNNPVAYWRLSETANNVGVSLQSYDYSGNNFDATYGQGMADNQPGPTYPGFEANNTGAGFLNNFAGSYMTAPSLNLNTNTVTITAWINPSSVVGAYWGLFTWANGSDKAGFGFGGTVNGSGVAELGYTWNSNSPATYGFNSGLYPLAGQWSFVSLVITPTNSSIYLYYIDQSGNTNLLKSVQASTNVPEAFSGGTIWIGSDTSDARDFNGSIDEVAVFNKSLSEGQIQDLYFKALGVAGLAPQVVSTTVYPSSTVYSGQNVILSANASGSVPVTVRWQSSPDGSTWTDVPGATSSTLVANPLTVGTVYYHLVAANSIGSGTNAATAVTFSALPATPAGLWTANFQVTNNVLNYTTGGGVGYYSGRGILGTGMYWNVLPNTAGAFGFVAEMDSVSDLKDDGTTHSGVYCSMFNASAFGSATVVQPDSSDIGNLLYQWVTIASASNPTNTNALQFHGVPDGTYNLAVYACDGSFGDRGATLVVHDPLNGDQTQSTVNASPIIPLQLGVNFVLFTGVHVSGGTLNVDVNANSPLPTHNPNTEADINGAQLQLVSYDVPAPTITLTNTVSGSSMTLNWSQGILQTTTNLLSPWTSIYSPSPVTLPITTTNAAQFYRVKVQ